MKTAIFFLFTTFISITCLETALGSKQPVLLYVIGLGVWALFAWYCLGRIKKKAERRRYEQHFRNFMRYQMRKPDR
jgi:O-antigen/teichoic acid export membrane protein